MPLTRDESRAAQQKAFDGALQGIRSQGYQRAVQPGTTSCKYRTSTGLKCAIGHLLPDHLPLQNYVGGVYVVLGMHRAARRALAERLGVSEEDLTSPGLSHFLGRLQSVHDDMHGDPKLDAHWFEDAMHDVAGEYGLTYTKPEN